MVCVGCSQLSHPRNQVSDKLYCKHRREKWCVSDLHLQEVAAQRPQLGSMATVILHIGKDETLVILNVYLFSVWKSMSRLSHIFL